MSNDTIMEQRREDFKTIRFAFSSVSLFLSGNDYEKFATCFSEELMSDFQEFERTQCESEERAKEHWVF